MLIKAFHRFSELASAFPGIQKQNPDEDVFICSEFPTRQDLEGLVGHMRCSKCSGSRMGLVAVELNPPAAAVMTRCLDCLEEEFCFVTSEKTTSPDIAIFEGSSKSLLYEGLFKKFTCPRPTCHALWDDLGIDKDRYALKNILPVLARCSKCRERFNIIFWDHPLTYFDHAAKLGNTLLKVSPEAALVFYASALENFLQKAFIFASDFNLFLSNNRKVSFQNLNEANKIYKEYFEIDLVDISGKADWQELQRCLQNRHSIVHNAGHDKNFMPIEVSEDDAQQFHDIVTDLVRNKLDKLLRKKLVY